MKLRAFVITFLIIHLSMFGQRVLIDSDTGISISIDSTGYGVTTAEEKAFFNNEFYKYGSKIIANLFYRPVEKMKHLVVAAEVEYAERRNIQTPSNSTTRTSFLIYYDF